MGPKPEDEAPTVGRAAREAGVSEHYMRRLVDRGIVRGVRGPLGIRIIDRESLREYIRRREARRRAAAV